MPPPVPGYCATPPEPPTSLYVHPTICPDRLRRLRGRPGVRDHHSRLRPRRRLQAVLRHLTAPDGPAVGKGTVAPHRAPRVHVRARLGVRAPHTERLAGAARSQTGTRRVAVRTGPDVPAVDRRATVAGRTAPQAPHPRAGGDAGAGCRDRGAG